ncbi:MAG TPA: 16S rRNA (cytidine(1402)-2'-O)-methyltransferase, partial [Vicinamibacteria bacterium]|nr:16S rRNA (cytidine(1402)-2'-O)-methyltransferase [Vicinamibacteria bacterium]
KGEIVLVVAGAPEAARETAPPEELFARLTAEGLTRRDAVKETARRLGLPAREVYRLVLER